MTKSHRPTLATALACLLLLCATPLLASDDAANEQGEKAKAALAASSQFGSTPGGVAAPSLRPVADPLPDSPGAVRFSAQNTPPPPAPSSPPPATPAQTATQNSSPSRPAGVAAAEAASPAGIAASQPAGAAIAPGKQRRSRSFLIKIGAIAGAGVALGTAMALSEATPSRPPGAH